ncbi:MAG: hypothetical protein FJY38_06165 [Betaproteobacteria bacterium]|nr:hypothetical protein [Betaproteobacteria bacterium]
MKIKSKVISCFLAALLVLQGQAIAGMSCHGQSHGDHHSHAHFVEASSDFHVHQQQPNEEQPAQQSVSAADTCAFCSGFCSMAQALNTHEQGTLLETSQSTRIHTSSQSFSSVVLEGPLRPPRS